MSEMLTAFGAAAGAAAGAWTVHHRSIAIGAVITGGKRERKGLPAAGALP